MPPHSIKPLIVKTKRVVLASLSISHYLSRRGVWPAHTSAGLDMQTLMAIHQLLHKPHNYNPRGKILHSYSQYTDHIFKIIPHEKKPSSQGILITLLLESSCELRRVWLAAEEEAIHPPKPFQLSPAFDWQASTCSLGKELQRCSLVCFYELALHPKNRYDCIHPLYSSATWKYIVLSDYTQGMCGRITIITAHNKVWKEKMDNKMNVKPHQKRITDLHRVNVKMALHTPTKQPSVSKYIIIVYVYYIVYINCKNNRRYFSRPWKLLRSII